jgi:hypothetical protein
MYQKENLKTSSTGMFSEQNAHSKIFDWDDGFEFMTLNSLFEIVNRKFYT